MNDLVISPSPPDNPPLPGVVVLGRFQPFHKGHELLILAAEKWRGSNSPESELIVAIGSSNRPETLRNPWLSSERESMVRAWADSVNELGEIRVVSIPDIEDPPNWVSHAERYHGESGVLFTSDTFTAELYEMGGWKVAMFPLEDRGLYEGWRVRETARMMSTISDIGAVREVLGATVPTPVIEYLVRIDGLKRLAFLGEGGEPVG